MLGLLSNFIGGRWTPAAAAGHLDVADSLAFGLAVIAATTAALAMRWRR